MIGMPVWWVYLAPRHFPSTIVLTVGNKVVLYRKTTTVFCFEEAEKTLSGKLQRPSFKSLGKQHIAYSHRKIKMAERIAVNWKQEVNPNLYLWKIKFVNPPALSLSRCLEIHRRYKGSNSCRVFMICTAVSCQKVKIQELTHHCASEVWGSCYVSAYKHFSSSSPAIKKHRADNYGGSLASKAHHCNYAAMITMICFWLTHRTCVKNT